MKNVILVVDDAKFARSMVKRVLQNGGYENILEAATAKEALELFEQGQPDLTLLDIALPDNTDLSLLQRMLKLRPDAKIVINSAIGQELIIADALRLGARDFVTKPFVEMEFIKIGNLVSINIFLITVNMLIQRGSALFFKKVVTMI